jgi:hypothetical protein
MTSQRGLRVGTETGSLVNHVSSMQGPDMVDLVVIGDGATILRWTDRTPATVVQIRAGKRPVIVIQEDRATRIDANGMSERQEYLYERNPDGATHEVSYRKGAWRVRGSDNGVRFGAREKYHDFSF